MAGKLTTSVFESDLTEIIADLYTSVTGLASNAVCASVTDLGYETQLEVGGEVVNITQSIIVRASAISAPPVIGSLCTIGTDERMVARWSLSPDGVSYNIDVADVSTG